MICLTDNDIILKLAYCDLLTEAFDSLQVAFGDILVLNSAIHKILNPKKPGKGKVKPNEPEYAKLQEFFDKVRVIDANPPPEELLAFNDIPGIDTGEAILFSATGLYDGSILATSDKRSLVALCAAEGEVCERVRSRLSGKVVCFEQSVLHVINQVGFDSILPKVVSGCHCDIALRAVLGSGISATRNGVCEGLISYIRDLRTQTFDLLIEFEGSEIL
jgi:hypothetical protein